MTANQTVEAKTRTAAEAQSASAPGAQAPAGDVWLLNTLEQGRLLSAAQVEGLHQTREPSFWTNGTCPETGSFIITASLLSSKKHSR